MNGAETLVRTLLACVALDMMDLGNPDIAWTNLAQGMGVEAARATTANEFADLFVQANKARGPFLIELII